MLVRHIRSFFSFAYEIASEYYGVMGLIALDAFITSIIIGAMLIALAINSQ